MRDAVKIERRMDGWLDRSWREGGTAGVDGNITSFGSWLERERDRE